MRAAGKYGAIVRATLLTHTTYGGDVLLRSAGMFVVLFTFVQLWQFTYAERGVELVAGFTLSDMIWYLVVTETVVLSAPRVSAKMDQEVKSGELAYVLSKPYNYVLYHFASYWGQALVVLPVNALLGAGVAVWAVGRPETSVAGFLAMCGALVLALTLNFLFEIAIGLTAFWVEDTQAFFWMYQKLVFTVGGMFLPLEFFPDVLRQVSAVLPFAAITYAPARLMVDFTPGSLVGLLALQVFWLGAMVIGVGAIYRRAVRKVSIHGG